MRVVIVFLLALLQSTLIAAWLPSSKHTSINRRNSLNMALSDGGAAAAAKKSVLFICLGNICRSPAAEAVFKQVVTKKGAASSFNIDSCGTGGGSSNWYQPGGFSYHEGDLADARMRKTATKRGIDITSTSRPLTPKDIDEFDLLICMDGSNKSAVLEAADHWGKYKKAAAKIKLMTDYCRQHKGVRGVPDPYYGGADSFEKVLDLLEDSCEGLYESP